MVQVVMGTLVWPVAGFTGREYTHKALFLLCNAFAPKRREERRRTVAVLAGEGWEAKGDERTWRVGAV